MLLGRRLRGSLRLRTEASQDGARQSADDDAVRQLQGDARLAVLADLDVLDPRDEVRGRQHLVAGAQVAHLLAVSVLLLARRPGHRRLDEGDDGDDDGGDEAGGAPGARAGARWLARPP